MVCTLIAKRLHWSSSSTLRKVALAGLFHDIGKRDFPREIIDLRTSQIPDSHRALYETHPILGSEILKRSKAIPLDVANAVLQHHEYINGAGFPHGLRLGKIQPIALILNLADEFSHQVMELDNPTKEDIHGILRKMMEEDWQKYAGEALVALHELFGLQVDAQLENKLMRGVLSAG
jgi:putative nucleotidyltransferase with HDIG domain